MKSDVESSRIVEQAIAYGTFRVLSASGRNGKLRALQALTPYYRVSTHTGDSEKLRKKMYTAFVHGSEPSKQLMLAYVDTIFQ